GQQVLPTLFVGDAEVVPLSAPLLVPQQLRVAFERRDPAMMSAAFGPIDVGRRADVGDGRSVELRRERSPDTSAALADHRDGKPAHRMFDVRDSLVDVTDLLGVAEHELDLTIELAGPVEVPHPIE